MMILIIKSGQHRGVATLVGSHVTVWAAAVPVCISTRLMMVRYILSSIPHLSPGPLSIIHLPICQKCRECATLPPHPDLVHTKNWKYVDVVEIQRYTSGAFGYHYEKATGRMPCNLNCLNLNNQSPAIILFCTFSPYSMYQYLHSCSPYFGVQYMYIDTVTACPLSSNTTT
jgi:hypothetical protein